MGGGGVWIVARPDCAHTQFVSGPATLERAEDQIIWARSPVRFGSLRAAGRIRRPYCLEFGGAVVNVAADLNGQPPHRCLPPCERPNSSCVPIDLGVEERL